MEVHAEKRVRANVESVFEVFSDVTKIQERIPGTRYLSTYAFEPVGDETVVHMTFSGTPETMVAKILGGLLGWMGKGAVKKMLQADLDSLADYVESQR
jgi:carbon monoxide dehydrogenase subunit G